MTTRSDHDGPRAGFCVLYRFRVHPQHERNFITAWSKITAAIRQQHGGLGSRLHRAEDGLWLAYAQWPDRQSWERAGQQTQPVDAEAAQHMAEAIAERFPPLPLTPVKDMLTLCPAAGEDPDLL